MTYESCSITSSTARIELEYKYRSILKPTQKFDRQLVSYQGNKSAKLHRWFRFKEAFSALLVSRFIKEFGLRPPQHILDPFAGVSTTLLVAREYGLAATGIEVMPVGDIVWRAKSQTGPSYVPELRRIRAWVESTPPGKSKRPFPHIPITHHAFGVEREAELMWYTEQFNRLDVSDNLKLLLNFILLSILEDISYTSKDGQFLRWDSRSGKVQKRNEKRIAAGKKPYKEFRKRHILTVQLALLKALDLVIQDASNTHDHIEPTSEQELLVGTVLETLPRQAANQFDAVITSPPYCNRYDYTRTYALELAFLGVSHQDLIALRQDLISCTVENRSKSEKLKRLYCTLGRVQDYETIMHVLSQNSAFQEILEALHTRNQRREVNNTGIISMVEGYFTELAFVTFELLRVCKPGASVVIVNDNVRYSSETIPVDLLMTDIAGEFGFTPEKVLVLAQRKGNSSQQMGKYGREALRKSILIWKKPEVIDAD